MLAWLLVLALILGPSLSWQAAVPFSSERDRTSALSLAILPATALLLSAVACYVRVRFVDPGYVPKA